MRTRNITNIIRNLYGMKYDIGSMDIVPEKSYTYMKRRSYLSWVDSVLEAIRNRWVLISSLTTIAVIAAVSVYYYNLLVMTEQNVLSSRAKVDTLLQRRNDISINLSIAVMDYSKHEREVFTAVVSLRTLLSGENSEKIKNLLADRTPNLPVQADSMSPLARLLAVAEQYPDLKLSGNFDSLMTALINVEVDLAAERISYNDNVNAYTTNLLKFPLNIYASLFGFKKIPYFEAEDSAKKLVPISY